MILALHLFIGAVIVAKIRFLFLGLLLAFLSHYLLDFLPHTEYLITNKKEKKWKKTKTDFLKLGLDFSTGLILILFIRYLTDVNYPILFTGAFFAILPDVLSVLNWLWPDNKILKYHLVFHINYIHFFKNKKIPLFWRIFSQVLIIIIVIALL